jgi:hypothetical protein
MKNISTQSYIQILVEIPTGHYGESVTHSQVIEQASREGKNAAKKVAAEAGWKIIGEPIVKTITSLEEK